MSKENGGQGEILVRFREDNLTIQIHNTYGNGAGYEVDLEELTTTGDMLDAVFQVADKLWASPRVIHDFLANLEFACRRVFDNNLQGVFCPNGEIKAVMWYPVKEEDGITILHDAIYMDLFHQEKELKKREPHGPVSCKEACDWEQSIELLARKQRQKENEELMALYPEGILGMNTDRDVLTETLLGLAEEGKVNIITIEPTPKPPPEGLEP